MDFLFYHIKELCNLVFSSNLIQCSTVMLEEADEIGFPNASCYLNKWFEN